MLMVIWQGLVREKDFCIWKSDTEWIVSIRKDQSQNEDSDVFFIPVSVLDHDVIAAAMKLLDEKSKLNA